MEDLSLCPDLDLLAELIGKQSARGLYKKSLRALFGVAEGSSGYPNSREERARRKLAVARELVKRSLAEELPTRDLFGGPSGVREYLQLTLGHLEREVFGCLFLDTRHRLIRFEVLFQGTIDATTVHPREVVKMVLRVNAAAVILAHNHPSGVAEPSHADQALTRRLSDALALIDVRVLDHFVIGEKSAVSFAERGWL